KSVNGYQNEIPNYMGTESNIDNSLAIDPNNPDIVYAGGTFPDLNNGLPGFIQVTFTGNSFSWMSMDNDKTGAGPHADHHAIGFLAPVNGLRNMLIDANDGGVWQFDTSKLVWADRTGNLATTQ